MCIGTIQPKHIDKSHWRALEIQRPWEWKHEKVGKETVLIIVGLATAKELLPTPVVWQALIVGYCNMDHMIKGYIYLNVRLKSVHSQKVDFDSTFYCQLTAHVEKLLKWKRHVEILLYFPCVMTRSNLLLDIFILSTFSLSLEAILHFQRT